MRILWLSLVDAAQNLPDVERLARYRNDVALAPERAIADFRPFVAEGRRND
jgi:hypothetical protein